MLPAGLFDAVENYGLIMQLLRGPSAFHAGLAYYFAVAKFALISLAIAHLLVGSFAWLLARRSHE